MIYACAEGLSTSLLPSEIADNWLYPDIRRIREVSVVVTRVVIRAAQKDGMDRELALRNLSDDDLDEYIRARMYDPFTEHHKIHEEIKDVIGHHVTGTASTSNSEERPITANGAPSRGQATHGDALSTQAV